MSIENISNAITTATKKLQALLTSFNNEFGEDGSARGLKALYDKYGLSNPPTTAEYDGMGIKSKVDYLFELRAIEDRALAIEAVHDELVNIDPGSGAFGDLADVKTWAGDNMGLVGIEAAKDCDVLTAVRTTLSPFISTAMLDAHSDAITAFRDENTNQIPNLGTN